MDNVTIATWQGDFTEEKALDSDLDMIPLLSSHQPTIEFQHELNSRRLQIEEIIRRHLSIPKSSFVLSQPSEWMLGSYNICLPIDINGTYGARLPRRALIRFPLPFDVGEHFSPGTIDEKVRCEAATYIWLSTNYPAVPIPRLLGMGFPGMQSVFGSRFQRGERNPWG